MMDTGSRLNGVIRALEQGQRAFGSFSTPDIDSALAFSVAKYDGIIFEMEHNPWDTKTLRDCLQYMLNRRLIAESDSVAPAVTPLVRIPPNGGGKSQRLAKQTLGLRVYRIVLPPINHRRHAYKARPPRPISRIEDVPRDGTNGAR